jgi:hypothetical protein
MDTTQERSPRGPAALPEPRDLDRIDLAGRMRPATLSDRGFLDSLLSLMGLDLNAPDHTTLSRRNRIVKLSPRSKLLTLMDNRVLTTHR